MKKNQRGIHSHKKLYSFYSIKTSITKEKMSENFIIEG